MNNKLVSIVIPYYNSEFYVERLLISIKRQIYTYFECILIDDGSDDESFELINNITHGDKRFINRKRPSSYRSGGRGAKNYGFNLCSGDLIVFFDADDEMENNFLSQRVDFLTLNVENDAVISNYNYRFSANSDKRNTLIYNSFLFLNFRNIVGCEDFWLHYLNYKVYYNPGNAMYRRSILSKSGMWNEKTSIGEDYEFHSRLILLGMNLGHINAVTFNYMLNDSSMIATSNFIEPLLSRSFGRILVLDNLCNKYGIVNSYLVTELNWQLRILRRIVLCKCDTNIKKTAIYIMLIRMNHILKLIDMSKYKKKFYIENLKLVIWITNKIQFGYRSFNLLLLTEKLICSYNRYMTFLKFKRL